MKSNDVFLEKIKKSLPMSFAQYMEMALYDGEYGYYTTQDNIIGQHGDFITAPELSPLFGRAIAKQVLEVFKEYPNAAILELGAGTGRLCLDVLSYLDKANALPEKYYILEVSPNLKLQQSQLLQAHLPHLFERIVWLNHWPQQSFQGVVLANEVLDAMPVHRFEWRNGQTLESHVVWDEKKLCLKEEFLTTNNSQLSDYVKSLAITQNHYRSEVNLWIQGWLSGIFSCLEAGVVLLIDYGFPRGEFYHPDRNDGTLMCHQRQQSSTDFLNQPGCMDITAHVDFTYVAETAYDLGFSILGYTQQAAFLLANGILEELANEDDTVAYHQEAIHFNHFR